KFIQRFVLNLLYCRSS
ncbi:hypothetical protein NPIL_704151, partial [Nephila pilipes]